MSNNYDNFVFYGSWRESLEGFREDFGDDYAKEVLWNIMLASTAGDIETTKKSILGFINGSVMPNVNKAKERYEHAVENGKKGGRPTTIDKEKVIELKNQGFTNKEVAEELKCSTKTVERVNRHNRQNLDIDIDNDIDNEKEKEKEIYNNNEHYFEDDEINGNKYEYEYEDDGMPF